MNPSLFDANAVHTLIIDLPLACVLVAPLLLVATVLRDSRNAALIVPAVMLFVLGVSSLYVALVETQARTEALRNVQTRAEVLQHQHDLVMLVVSAVAVAILLFVIGLLVRRTLAARTRQTSWSATFVVFVLAYIPCAGWLLIAAHQAARLADHLAEHARP